MLVEGEEVCIHGAEEVCPDKAGHSGVAGGVDAVGHWQIAGQRVTANLVEEH